MFFSYKNLRCFLMKIRSAKPVCPHSSLQTARSFRSQSKHARTSPKCNWASTATRYGYASYIWPIFYCIYMTRVWPIWLISIASLLLDAVINPGLVSLSWAPWLEFFPGGGKVREPSVFNGTGLEPSPMSQYVTVADRPNVGPPKIAESPKVGVPRCLKLWKMFRVESKTWRASWNCFVCRATGRLSTWVLLFRTHELITGYEKQHRRATLNHPKPWLRQILDST